MIVGKVSDNEWQIMDPATEKLNTYAINGNSINYMGVANQIDSVRQYYNPDAAPSGERIVNEYPCRARVTTPASAELWNMACTGETSENARVVDHTAAGGSYEADMICENSEGDYFYRITKDGVESYLFAGDISRAETLDPGITVSGLVVPYTLNLGKAFNIEGLVSSPHLPMDQVGAYIYQGTEAAGTPHTFVTDGPDTPNSYDIRKGDVNNNLKFGDLSEGLYTYQLVVEVTRYAAAGNELTAETEAIELARQIFTVGNLPFVPDSEVHFGIDVSHHQGVIDWDAVAPNIEFAIIRCGYGMDETGQDDEQWKANADACTRLGIPFGVYLYSYATTEERARSEAAHVLRLIEGYEPTLPIFLDLEHTSITDNCSNEEILRNAQVFCDIIEEAGYTVGVYSFYSWWTDHLNLPEYENWPRWIARFASAPGYNKPYQIWQYSDTGTLPGISGAVDLDYWYGPLPEPAHTHAYEAAVTDPTCTEDGLITYTCPCGDSYTEVIEKTGHRYDSRTVEATCTDYGYTVYTCQCGDSYTDFEGSYSEWTTEKPAGVDESLIQSRTEYRYSDYETITSYEPDLPGWEPVGSEWMDTDGCVVFYVREWPEGFLTTHELYDLYNGEPLSPGETETEKTEIISDDIDGYLYYHWCRGRTFSAPDNRGGKDKKQGEFIVFHAFYDTTDPSTLYAVSDGSVKLPNADCCRDSHWYFYTPVYAQRSSTAIKVFTYERWSDWSGWSETEYTGSETRQVQGRTVYRVFLGELADHSWDEGVITAAPTEESEGVLTYTCAVCGGQKTETLPRLEHTHRYEAAVTAPTCTEKGYTTHTCPCGDSFVDSYTEPLGHDMGQWATVTEATCTEGGEERRHCARCGYRETRVTEATGHAYASAVTAPTCTERGYTTHTCPCGDSFVDGYTEALGHRWKGLACERCDAVRENPFTDVPEGSFYLDPVLWAVEWGVTEGTSDTTFNPSGVCQRAVVVTFLWRAAGSPEPASNENPFTDVKENAFYYKAVLWAVENGITTGTGETTFDPGALCNRATVVTFLYRAMGEPEVNPGGNPFTDVKAGSWFAPAVAWAVEKGITSGVGNGLFAPGTNCNRAQVVTFLYRAMA